MSLHKDIILGEIGGKNAAIHAYDKILWMIRTGYLTLLYGGWAIVLAGIIEKGGDLKTYAELLIIMSAVTLGLAVGAYFVDKNYLRRKFRVIFSLNMLLMHSFRIRDEEAIDESVMDELQQHIKVSGDADNETYKTDGYMQAVRAEYWIYGFSVLSLAVAVLFVLR